MKTNACIHVYLLPSEQIVSIDMQISAFSCNFMIIDKMIANYNTFSTKVIIFFFYFSIVQCSFFRTLY